MSAILEENRAGLPDIDNSTFKDNQALNNLLNNYKENTGITLQKTDGLYQVFSTLSYALNVLDSNIDIQSKRNYLSYNTGKDLDHFSSNFNIVRLPATPSLTTLEFSLTEVQAQDYLIPAGTEVTNSSYIFETVSDVKILAGELSAQILAVSQVAGDETNGIPINTITTIVQPLDFVQVTNITQSSDGADIEDDDSLAERTQLVVDSYTTAGAKNAYIFHVKSVSPLINEVQIVEPTIDFSNLVKADPNFGVGNTITQELFDNMNEALDSQATVEVYFTLKDGSLPSQELRDQVLAALDKETVRPLTDRVLVPELQTVLYDIDLEYFIGFSNASSEETIKSNVEQAIQDYIFWQKSKLGRDINPQELISRIRQAGANRVVINNGLPSYTSINSRSLAINNSLNITYGGIEND